MVPLYRPSLVPTRIILELLSRTEIKLYRWIQEWKHLRVLRTPISNMRFSEHPLGVMIPGHPHWLAEQRLNPANENTVNKCGFSVTPSRTQVLASFTSGPSTHHLCLFCLCHWLPFPGTFVWKKRTRAQGFVKVWARSWPSIGLWELQGFFRVS